MQGKQAETYQEILDQLAQGVEETLQQHKLLQLPLPDTLMWQGNHRGTELSIRPVAYTGTDVPMARLVRVDGGENVQVLNLVVFPSQDSSLPIFGCELLVFKKGLHLLVLDMFPTESEATQQAWYSELQTIRQEVEDLHALNPIPEWGQHVFSEHAVVLKPSPKTPLSLEAIVPLFWKSWNTWLEAYRAQPQAASSNEVGKARARYLHHHAVDEPAGPFLQRLAGEEWSHNFIHEFLFPQWLQERDLSAPWLSSLLNSHDSLSEQRNITL